MAWLSEPDRERLRAELERSLSGDVLLVLSAAEDEAGRQASEVLGEIAALSSKLRLSKRETSGPPTIEIRGRSRGRVAFLGLPMGYEFPTLFDAIRDVSRGETSLSGEVRARLDGLDRDRRLRVFTTPT